MIPNPRQSIAFPLSKPFLKITMVTRFLISLAILIVLILLPFGTVSAQTFETVGGDLSKLYELKSIPARFVGRMQVSAPHSLERRTDRTSILDPLLSYSHQWPGIYFEAGFKGTTFYIAFSDPDNEYRLIVDNNIPIPIIQPDNTVFKMSGLTNTQHQIRLEKVTESIGQRGAFRGFYTLKTDIGILPLPKKRQIEFIGDSGMTGYGIRSSTRQCTQEEVRLRSDTQNAYPVLAAKYFDADYRINAISGRGLVRNYDGIVPAETMSQIYPYVFFDKTIRAQKTKWLPQFIVIGLGDNDFSTPLKSDEKWKNQSELIADYFEKYDAFLLNLHRQNPRALLILLWPDDENWRDEQSRNAFVKGTAHTVNVAKKRGINLAQFDLYKDVTLDSAACDYHSSIQDHKKLAARMITLLSSQLYQWTKP